MELYGKTYKGKALYDALEQLLRKGYYAIDPEEKQRGMDMLWYTWCHANSPVFGKDKTSELNMSYPLEKLDSIDKAGSGVSELKWVKFPEVDYAVAGEKIVFSKETANFILL